MQRRIDQHRRNRIHVRVLVVYEHPGSFGNNQGYILDPAVRVRVRQGNIIGRRNYQDRNRARRIEGPVKSPVVERVKSLEIHCGRIRKGADRIKREISVSGLGYDFGRERCALRVLIVTQDTHIGFAVQRQEKIQADIRAGCLVLVHLHGQCIYSVDEQGLVNLMLYHQVLIYHVRGACRGIVCRSCGEIVAQHL